MFPMKTVVVGGFSIGGLALNSIFLFNVGRLLVKIE
jgi:hypothetical protein